MVYIGSSKTQLIPASVHLVDLLSNCLLGRSLGDPSVEGCTFLRVGEVLAAEDLKLPVLLDKCEYGESIVGERPPKDGRDHPCGLCRGYVSRSEIT